MKKNKYKKGDRIKLKCGCWYNILKAPKKANNYLVQFCNTPYKLWVNKKDIKK